MKACFEKFINYSEWRIGGDIHRFNNGVYKNQEFAFETTLREVPKDSSDSHRQRRRYCVPFHGLGTHGSPEPMRRPSTAYSA